MSDYQQFNLFQPAEHKNSPVFQAKDASPENKGCFWNVSLYHVL